MKLTPSNVYCCPLRLTSTATSVDSSSASLVSVRSSSQWLSVASPLLAANANRHEARGANPSTATSRQSTIASRSTTSPEGESAVL